MAVSRSRTAIRVLLVLIIAGLVWVGYRSQIRNHPDFHWSRAERAIAAKDQNAAKIHLQNMMQRFPQDARGYRAMATLLVEEAKLPDGADGYAAHPVALNMLVEAGKLQEDDLELQKLLVASALQAGRAQDAAAAAQRVAKVEPKNADALFARAWQAVDKGDEGTALRLLDQLPAAEKTRFRTLGLRAQVLQAEAAQSKDSKSKNPQIKNPKLQETLEGIAQQAAGLSGAQLKAMPGADLNILERLLPAAVGAADDVGTAYRRADAALSVAEKLSDVKSPHAAAGKKMVAQVSAVLNARYPTLALGADMELARQRFTERLAKLLPTEAPANKDQKTEMVVAHEAALLAFDKGEFATAVKILDQALAQHQSDKRARPEEAQALHLLAARSLLGLQRHREAKVHLNALLADKRTTGIGQLMLGAVASAEGRHQDALGQFLRAERELGSNPLVEISLAQTYLALAQWEAALPHLTALHELLQTDNPELQAWVKQHDFSEARIHLQEARALLALKRQDDARPHLLALTGTPLESQAAVLEADLLFSLGDLAGADRVLRAALAKFPTDAQLVGNRAALLKKQDKTDELARFLAASAAAAPGDLRMQLIVARELVRAGQPAEAIAALDALEKQHPDMVPILLLKADALMQSGKLAEAQAVAEKIQGLSNSGALGGMVGAVVALRANDPKQAALALKASAEEAPDNLQVRHLEAELAAVSGDYPAAIAALGESVRVTSLRGRAGPLLCFCVAKLAEKSGAPAAEAAVLPLVEKMPDEPFVLIAHSDVLAMQGKFHDSLEQLDLLESLEKTSALPAYLKAVVLARAGDQVAALADVNRALALNAKYVPALTLAAQLNLAAKAYPAAIANLDAAIGAAPAAWNLAVLKSEVLWAAGKHSEAVEVARALAVKMPEIVEARRHLVALQSREAKPPRYEAALADCRAAREKFADDVPLTVHEVLLLQLVGKAAESQALADTFVGQPASAEKAFLLAQGFGQLQKFSPAQTWAETAMKTAAPELKPQLHRFLGMLAMSQQGAKGDRKLLEQAREHFTAVLSAQPQDFVSGNNLAWILAVDFDQPAEAVKVAERARAGVAVERLPITFVDTLAVVYRRAGEFKKAAALLDEALQAHPEENVLKFHLGMTLGQLDRGHEAKQLLREAVAGKLSPPQEKEAQQELARLDAAQAAAEAAAQAAAEAKAAKKAEQRAAKAAADADAKRDNSLDKAPAAGSN